MMKFKHFCVAFFIIIFASQCTKVDTTDLGQGLIPPVDGVNTLVTDTFTITTENGLFNDTTRLFKSDDQILGILQNNANFGSTNASMYVQFNPSTQFSWPAKKDSIISQLNQGIDSAFLCLGLYTSATDNGIYGDTTSNITFNVYRINTTNFKSDSSYLVAQNPNITDDGVVIGTATFAPKDLRKLKYFKLKQSQDSIANQVRIKLNATGQAWVRDEWLHKDSSLGSTFNSLTSFTSSNKGFVIKPVSGNAALKITLSQNIASRFEVWYRYKKNGFEDTASQYFYFNNTGSWLSANANYIKRTVSGSNMFSSVAPGADNLVYIETTPGSYTKIKVPYLKQFPNKMIHKAELIIEEDPAFYDPLFYTPSRLFLDCFDSVSTNSDYHSVPIDYAISNGSVDFNYFGGDRKIESNGAGGTHSVYRFNISKYFQSMITRNTTQMNFRLFSPFDTRYYAQKAGYYSYFNSTFENTVWPLINPMVFGRVVVGGGNHPTRKMKLRVIYSNI